jgi:hypothetical protein
MTELLLGCGHSRVKQAHNPGTSTDWENLVTLDSNGDCKPDLHCNLNDSFWLARAMNSIGEKCLMHPHERSAIQNDFFSEVHAYEVLEHLGTQGDYASFFHTFYNIWRVLINGGILFATCPSRHSAWAWGDPGHTRLIQPESLVFLDQNQYTVQLGKTPMTDYRSVWKGDFKILSSIDDRQCHRFVLEAVKPARN